MSRTNKKNHDEEHLPKHLLNSNTSELSSDIEIFCSFCVLTQIKGRAVHPHLHLATLFIKS